MASRIPNESCSRNIPANVEEGAALPVENVNSVAMGVLSNPQFEAGLSNGPGSAASLSQKETDEKDVQARALSLMQSGMDEGGKALILKAIRKIPPGEREDVIQRASPLMRDDMPGGGKAIIVDAIRAIPSEERENVMQQALPLMQDNRMHGWDKAGILTALRRTPPGEREDVIQRALPLLQAMNAYNNQGAILDAIRQIPSGEREDVIQRALPLMLGDMMSAGGKSAILNAIRMLPVAQRNPRAVRALEQIQIDFPGGEYGNINIYLNRVRQLLETPLNQAFLPMGQANNNAMAAAAAAGHAEINVHAGQRDARVKVALLLLRESQKMTDQEIDSAANACVQYLQAGGHNQALWVLNGPNNPNDYGPFFKKMIINGTSTSGQEVIGRLWGFIHALPESDKALALHSLVAELENCINEQGERICNPGKMQHVFIAVLQGRLAGVQVDDSIEIPKINQGESSSSASSQAVPIQGAIRVFFAAPKHQGIDKLESLLIAAHTFCDANPLVDREAFIQELKNYAAASGIQ